MKFGENRENDQFTEKEERGKIVFRNIHKRGGLRNVNQGGPMKKIRKELLFTILLTLLILVVLYLIYLLGWKPSKFIYQEF
jgi:hypothetical protein